VARVLRIFLRVLRQLQAFSSGITTFQLHPHACVLRFDLT
jgi:hypothetical protein